MNSLPISQSREKEDVRAAAHEEMTPSGSMSVSMLATLDMQLCPEFSAPMGAVPGQSRANDIPSTPDLFGSFPTTPSPNSCALDETPSLREPAGPPMTFGARVATPEKWCRPLRESQPQQSSWPAPPPPQRSFELASSSSAPPASPQPGSEALGSDSSSSAQQSTRALGSATSAEAAAEPLAGALRGRQTFPPSTIPLRRASKKRKPEEAELQEQDRRKRVCFNIQEAMQADAPIVRACLEGFKMPPWLYEALRLKYCEYYASEHAGEAESMSAVDFRRAARAHFAKSGNTLRLRLLRKMLDDHDTVSQKWTEIKMAMAKIQYASCMPLVRAKDKRCKAQVPMFTYQSKDWFLEELELQEGEEPWEPESLVARARDLPKVTAVWTRYQAFLDEKAKELSAQWVASQELCLETYAKTGKVRFHLAVVFLRQVPMRFKNPWDYLEFENAPAIYAPKVGPQELVKAVKAKGINGVFAQAAYYLQMPKIGMVHNCGTQQPYKDYRVNARWITEYMQAATWDFCKAKALGFARPPVLH